MSTNSPYTEELKVFYPHLNHLNEAIEKYRPPCFAGEWVDEINKSLVEWLGNVKDFQFEREASSINSIFMEQLKYAQRILVDKDPYKLPIQIKVKGLKSMNINATPITRELVTAVITAMLSSLTDFSGEFLYKTLLTVTKTYVESLNIGEIEQFHLIKRYKANVKNISVQKMVTAHNRLVDIGEAQNKIVPGQQFEAVKVIYNTLMWYINGTIRKKDEISTLIVASDFKSETMCLDLSYYLSQAQPDLLAIAAACQINKVRAANDLNSILYKDISKRQNMSKVFTKLFPELDKVCLEFELYLGLGLFFTRKRSPLQKHIQLYTYDIVQLLLKNPTFHPTNIDPTNFEKVLADIEKAVHQPDLDQMATKIFMLSDEVSTALYSTINAEEQTTIFQNYTCMVKHHMLSCVVGIAEINDLAKQLILHRVLAAQEVSQLQYLL